jgi:predicted transcriptional regulator
MRVLLSIKPEYAEKIFNGTKRFEYRKIAPRDVNFHTVVLYVTMPVGKIVGEFEVASVLRESPVVLWRQTKAASGISRRLFDAYFKGRAEAVAIAVQKPKRYPKPLMLQDVLGSDTPPQSFQYLPDA